VRNARAPLRAEGGRASPQAPLAYAPCASRFTPPAQRRRRRRPPLPRRHQTPHPRTTQTPRPVTAPISRFRISAPLSTLQKQQLQAVQNESLAGIMKNTISGRLCLQFLVQAIPRSGMSALNFPPRPQLPFPSSARSGIFVETGPRLLNPSSVRSDIFVEPVTLKHTSESGAASCRQRAPISGPRTAARRA
jgi:hypothetical protein